MEKLEALESFALELVPRLELLCEQKDSPVLLIDGRAGAGKSSLAEALRNALFKSRTQAPSIIHMDDLYPGWGGLNAGSVFLVNSILEPLVRSGSAQWQNWDWGKGHRGGPDVGNGWRSFHGGNLLVVEGCGSVSKRSRELADLAVWVESDREIRYQRFIARDDGKFVGQWPEWSAQEDLFYSSEDSKALCDIVLSN